MARLHKIGGYVVDVDESFFKFELENALERMDMIVHHVSIESVDIGEWEDDNPLNYTDCDLKECEKWFPKETTIETDHKWISVKDRPPTKKDMGKGSGCVIAILKEEGYARAWYWDIVSDYPSEFTYWMPFPETPKEMDGVIE